MSTYNRLTNRDTRDKIDTHTRRAQAMQILLHLGSQKEDLILKSEKIDELPRLKAIQEEMCGAVVMIDGLVKAFKRAEAGEPEPKPKLEIKNEVKLEAKEEEDVKIKKEIKMEDAYISIGRVPWYRADGVVRRNCVRGGVRRDCFFCGINSFASHQRVVLRHKLSNIQLYLSLLSIAQNLPEASHHPRFRSHNIPLLHPVSSQHTAGYHHPSSQTYSPP